MNTKHTPGPWKYVVWHDQHGVHDAMDNDVCETFGEEAEANARLIAAAPDLLSACRMALGDITQTVNYDEGDPQTLATVAAIEAAIAKATGTNL